jgi:hypothetical protein
LQVPGHSANRSLMLGVISRPIPTAPTASGWQAAMMLAAP